MKKNKFKMLANLLSENKKSMLASMCFSALGSICTVAPFVLIFKVIEYFLTHEVLRDLSPVILLFALALINLILKYLFAMISFSFAHIAAFDLVYKIRINLAGHLGRLPVGYFGKKNSGQILKIMQDDVESIESFVGHQVPDAVAAFTLPIVILCYLFYLDWRLAVVTAIPFGLMLILFKLATKGFLVGQNRKEITQKYHHSMEKMNSAILEFVKGMPIIKIFNITADSFKKLRNSILNYQKTVVDFQKGATPYRALIGAIVLGGGIFILPLAFYLLQKNMVDSLTVIFFLLLGTGCFFSMLKVMVVWTRMELIVAGMQRIENIFQANPLSEPKNICLPQKNNISIKNVSFKYNEKDDNVLKDINMEIKENAFIAFVGASGAGKTTLINLIARMWDVTKGEIAIGKVSLDKIGSKGVTQKIGTVFQEVQILTDTVENNIRMGNQKVAFCDVEAAAKAAACHEFISELPSGYKTIIGEGGESHLSGGERQRIALARVILKDTPIVLLDEATSYADAEVETKMQKSFSELATKKMVIVIAHRLSTIVNADQIFVFKKGQIIERGTHDELLKEDRVYKKMWTLRTEARKWSARADSE